jgi:hypothetical protein
MAHPDTTQTSHPSNRPSIRGIAFVVTGFRRGKTKNDYLREMIGEVLDWGLSPRTVTSDTWYSSQKNLKLFKDKELRFLTGIAKNRSC